MMDYKVNEIFYSLQGEGQRAGTANVFVRLCGCNMRCEVKAGPKSPGGFDCDTDFVSGRRLTTDDIVAEAVEEYEHEMYSIAEGMRGIKARPGNRWVIFTGGEPAIQLDNELIEAFHQADFKCAIETNGSMDVSDLKLDWITVSPKVAEHTIKQMEADEIKYVRGHGQAIPEPRCKSYLKFISPAFNGLAIDDRALWWCLDLVKTNPDWQLTVQAHKLWGVR